MDQNELIVKSFSNFMINSNLHDSESISDILSDEIISQYICNTIKQLFDQYEAENKWLDYKLEESLEIENFIEVIDAYITGFDTLNQTDIINWLSQLKQDLDQTKTKQSKEEEKTLEDESPKSEDKPLTTTSCVNFDSNVILLSEMFPKLSLKEINSVYKKTQSSYEHSIDELLRLQELEENTIRNVELSEEDKKLLKERTVQKFGLVEVKNQEGEAKLNVPKWDDSKKLVRYFENKVVTTKGEKYFEPKTEEDEAMEKKMKKTYVNLKPARKYRFH